MDEHGRFFRYVDASGDCWEWTASKTREGYGQTASGGAHVKAWRLLVGEVPAGLQLDHLCRNRSCVNPDHLEPVTPMENTKRSRHPHILTREQGVCRRGHRLEGHNAIPIKSGGAQCRECHSAAKRLRYAAITRGAHL